MVEDCVLYKMAGNCTLRVIPSADLESICLIKHVDVDLAPLSVM